MPPFEQWFRAEATAEVDHTMGPDLLQYLRLKVHSLILAREWKHIFVVGDYDRTAHISATEKNDKLFNWHRPTARSDGESLTILCYPGRDYVDHYSRIIATYVFLNRRSDTVHYLLPSREQSLAEVNKLLLDASQSEIAVLGWGLEALAGADAVWNWSEGYAWTRRVIHSRSVLYVGFLHSIWGDVAGKVVTRLAELGVRTIVYVGKVGTLNKDLSPNRFLATGSTSFVEGSHVEWNNFFGDSLRNINGVISGSHITSSSILLETCEWLRQNQGQFTFVDPEIGHMGLAATQARVSFGYLHIVSNNLARLHQENLSNERSIEIVRRRTRLIRMIGDCICLRIEGFQ